MGLDSNNWKRTNWKYETSEDTTASVFLTYSSGIFVLRNTITRDVMRVRYKCLSGSLSKGLPLGVARSTYEMESNGSAVHALGHFGEHIFPCNGFILGIGATMGVLDSNPGPPDEKFANGFGGSLVLFETIPFARFACGGQFVASTPGLGISVGVASYSLA
ncbi:MAG: hypothetical protein JNM13_08135 [Hyphomicrobiaceae bacterium]|nr:hypothetical protein [Hyphomicrobiaceae bacterium]